MIKKISLALLVFFGLTNCNQSSYATGSTDARNALVLIIMPEQNCKEKEKIRRKGNHDWPRFVRPNLFGRRDTDS